MNAPTIEQLVGTVLELGAPEILVRVGTGARSARRAVSCLVAPKVGDTVTLAALGERAFVLSVLETEEAVVLGADGDLRVDLPDGRLVVAAQEGISLLSGADATVLAASFDVQATEATAAIQRTTLVTESLRTESEKAEVVATSFDSVVERIALRVKRLFRKVEETDQLRAGSIDLSAKKEISMHAENAQVTAEELVKMDGEQIQVG